MRLPLRLFLFWALIVAAGMGASLVTRAQPAASPPDVLPALLTEVRALRVAMEQMASAGPRVQLALGRLQLQEQRVNALGRRLEIVKANQESPQREVRHALGANQRTDRFTAEPERLGSTRDRIRDESGKAEHARLGAELQETPRRGGCFSTRRLRTSKTRWTDLNQRMEELERSLTRR